MSAHARMLPFLEQTNVFNTINFSLSWNPNATYGDPNATARATSVAVFLCPSDANEALPTGYAGNNYRACEGSTFLFGYVPGDPNHTNAGQAPPNGPFWSNSAVRMSQVRDGLSNTAAFSEHIKGDFSQATASERADTFRPGTYPATVDEAVAQCREMNWQDLSFQGVSDVGAPWLYGYHSTTTYYHVSGPNTRSCMFPPQRIATTANSEHPGGVNVLMGDGSVRFIKDSVSLAIWRGMGSRNLGEVISADAL
jgi:prepilin-type processing-associated H-X9-DG protein